MKRSLTALALLIVVLATGAGWYLYSKQPSRQGMVELQHLQGSVTVRYDERGVPHIRADNETDLYRALGYVHAQGPLVPDGSPASSGSWRTGRGARAEAARHRQTDAQPAHSRTR
ncbi:UNVERIFIED_ORG: hypothetical protein OKW15_001946 [Pseudomonas reinekei]|nr:hypothetical protein [Pseudomonas reinekei]